MSTFMKSVKKLKKLILKILIHGRFSLVTVTVCTVEGENEKFTLSKKYFVKSSLVNSLVKSLLSRDFSKNNIRVNFRNFHTVIMYLGGRRRVMVKLLQKHVFHNTTSKYFVSHFSGISRERKSGKMEKTSK